MKKYLPITYVDENGECYTGGQLKNKLFKRYEREEYEKHDEFTGFDYIYTIQRIGNVREMPKQGQLFD